MKNNICTEEATENVFVSPMVACCSDKLNAVKYEKTANKPQIGSLDFARC